MIVVTRRARDEAHPAENLSAERAPSMTAYRPVLRMRNVPFDWFTLVYPPNACRLPERWLRRAAETLLDERLL